MDNKYDHVVRRRKKVEVLFVPDEVIGTIITAEEPSFSKNNGSFHQRRQLRNEYTPTSRGRMTRSGRHITNRFENLSINDSPVKRITQNGREEKSDSSDNADNDTGFIKHSDCLFGEDDVDGRTMFSFKSGKRSNSMLNKAAESAYKCPPKLNYDKRLPTTPKCLPSAKTRPAVKVAQVPKTPYGLREKIKKVLVDEATKLELDRLLEDSGSDYIPSSDDSEGDVTTTDDSSDDILPLGPESAKKREPSSNNNTDIKEDKANITPTKSRHKKRSSNYIFTSEEYFDRQYNKVITSNHTLNKLKTPRLAQNQLSALLKGLAPGHKQALKDLENEVEVTFKRWLFSLSEGYNMLLYGLGSKKEILRKFQEKYLRKNYVIVINGYFPDLSLKEMLDYLSTDMLGIQNPPSQPHEIIEMISNKLKMRVSPRVFLLINNIDGPMLRNDKAQSILSGLAQIPKVHIVATVDHINCALLWDQKKMSGFNFIWEDATAFRPYIEETSFETSLMVQRSGGLALTALKNVYLSLTNNSRKVFKLLLKHRLENEEKKYSGMNFLELYKECRSKFIVSSDLALRTLLTEFLDHELVKWKKDTDQLVISIELNVLQQFHLELDSLER